MRYIKYVMILFVACGVLSACYTDDIESPVAELSIYAISSGGDTTEIQDGGSVSVGTEVLFKSTGGYVDYAAVWPGERGDPMPNNTGGDSTDVLGNTVYEYSYRFEDYGLTNARGFNMNLSGDKISREYTGFSYQRAGTYTVTLITTNYGRYETGTKNNQVSKTITVEN